MTFNSPSPQTTTMAHLRACPSGPIPIISRALLNNSLFVGPALQSFPTGCKKPWSDFSAKGRIWSNGRWVSLDFVRNEGRGRLLERRGDWVCWFTSAGEVGCVGESEGRKRGGSGQVEYLVSEFGWRVRRMAEVGDEMKRVAYVQAEAFHVPVALFDDLFFEFFRAEVLSDLIYRLRNSAPSRYACLVAEPMDASNLLSTSLQEIVGVADVTVQRDKDVLRHLDGADEYLYVSGIAVLKTFRRQKVASVLLKACDTLSFMWGFNCLALRAYEDDLGARKLYSNAGYRVVSGDSRWLTTWIGRKRRVLMIKQSSSGNSC